MPSNHLILCHPLLLLPSISPSIRVFSNESAVRIRWPKYWSFSFSISPSNEHPGLISFRMDWLDLLAVQGTLKGLLQHHSSKASILQHSAFFIVQLSHPYMTTGKTIALTRWIGTLRDPKRFSAKMPSSWNFTEISAPKQEMSSQGLKSKCTSPVNPLIISVSCHKFCKIFGDDVTIPSLRHKTLDPIPSCLPRHFSILKLLSLIIHSPSDTWFLPVFNV